MNFVPLNDRVLVKRKEASQVTPGGLHIPSQATEKPSEGVVVAVGNGEPVVGSLQTRPLTIREGDTVLFGKYSGTEIELEGNKFLILKEAEVLGFVN